MFGDNGMKDKILDQVLEMLMSLKGSEELEKEEGEGLPEDGSKDGAVAVEIEAEPLKANA